jgi:cytochrome c peroxidase
MFVFRMTARNLARGTARRTITKLRMAPSSGNRLAGYVCAVAGVALLTSTVAVNAPATDFKALRADIVAAIEAEDSKREDGSSIQGTLVRLAWHACGTYDCQSKTGGSDGATMRFAPESEWGANAGLQGARDFLEPLKKKYPGITYADLWTLAGVVAIENMGGPEIAWRCGRSDSAKPTTVPDGRLPNADMGSKDATAKHIREIFHRMGFTDREIVALLGAHSVGRCHTDASGYWGPWTYAESTFSNEFFRLLFAEKWREKKTHNGKPWKGPKQYESADGKIMMLPADLVMMQDAEFSKAAKEYAANEELFFKEFAAAFGKLMELGVDFKTCPHAAAPSKGLFGLGFWGL